MFFGISVRNYKLQSFQQESMIMLNYVFLFCQIDFYCSRAFNNSSIINQSHFILFQKKKNKKMISFNAKNPIKKLVLAHNRKEQHKQNQSIAKLPPFKQHSNQSMKTHNPPPQFLQPDNNLNVGIWSTTSFASKKSVSVHQDKHLKQNYCPSLEKKKKEPLLLNGLQITQTKQEKNFAKKMTEQLLNQLKKQTYIKNLHHNFYSIKRVDLQDIIQYLLAALFTKQKKIMHSKKPWAHILHSFTSKVIASMHQTHLKDKQVFLKHSKQYSRTIYQQKQFFLQVNIVQNQLQNILRTKKQNEQKIKDQIQLIAIYNKEIELKIIRNESQMHQQTVLNQNIKQLQDRKGEIAKTIEQFRTILDQTRNTSERITNFVNLQNNKILIMVSEQYKQTEAEIYQYASKLQINRLASEMGYEPHPFSQIQRLHLQEMKRINKAIIQADHLDTQTKHRMMRDFVLATIDKFKKKDEEMTKVLNFRTKCIRTYIDNMKKFLSNWELKQEYLVNLRNQFLIDSNNINKCFDDLTASVSCQGYKKLGDKTKMICDLYKKIELNYKMGNLFY